MMSPSGHYDRESLLHDAADDSADWGLQTHRVTAIRMSEQYRREQDEAAQRIRVLHESAERICCNGNCNQGRACSVSADRHGVCVNEPEPDTSKPSLLRRLMKRWGL